MQRQLVDTANAPIFGIDRDGNVNEWNLKTAEITGYSREDAFNKPLGKHLHLSLLKLSKFDFCDSQTNPTGISIY